MMIYKRNYHIPWEYLFNLSLDLLHNESIKKINIPEMIEVKFEWFFRNIDLINKQCSTIEKIYRLALLFEDIKEIEAYNILINKIMSKLDKELQEINKIKQVKYKEKIKTKSSEIDKQIFYLEKKSQDKTTQIKSLQANIKDNEAKLVQIQNLNNTLNNTIKEKDQLINSKSTQLNQIQSKLSFQTKYGTAKARIQNQLSYKLGQAMIVNSKSILGYLIMPMVLLSIMISHKQEQKIYQEKIKKDPSLKLPPLESYPDYKEALKFKNHLSYKLGEALIKASNNWYGGGYIKLWFEIGKLKREFRKKDNHA